MYNIIDGNVSQESRPGIAFGNKRNSKYYRHKIL